MPLSSSNSNQEMEGEERKVRLPLWCRVHTDCRGRAGGTDCRGRAGGTDCRGRAGGADCRGRAGGTDCRGRAGGTDCRGRACLTNFVPGITAITRVIELLEQWTVLYLEISS